MVFLNYLGTEGSGASNPNLHNVYQIGHGTSKCIMTAIINCMKDKYYKWLSARGHKEYIKMDQAPVPFPQLCLVYGWNT